MGLWQSAGVPATIMVVLETAAPAGCGDSAGTARTMENRAMSTTDALRDAINNLSVVTFSFDGWNRVCEPYILGTQIGKDGEEELFVEAYQVSGGSGSGGIPEWRTFLLDDIRGLVTTEKHFTPRSSFNPDRGRWQTVLASVR